MIKLEMICVKSLIIQVQKHGKKTSSLLINGEESCYQYLKQDEYHFLNQLIDHVCNTFYWVPFCLIAKY